MKSLQNTMHHPPGCDSQVGHQGPPPPPKPQPPSPPRCHRQPHPARPTILLLASRTGRQGRHLHPVLCSPQSFVHQIGLGETPPSPHTRLVKRNVQAPPSGGVSPRLET